MDADGHEAALETLRTQGYLVVDGGIDAALVARLREAVLAAGADHQGEVVNVCELFARDPRFIELLDHPSVLPLVLAMLGGNIWVNHTHLNLNRPQAEEQKRFAYTWHRDGGRTYADMGDTSPLIAIKVGFYLTDLTEPHAGQTYVLPGSHRGTRELPDEHTMPGDAVPLMTSPGAVVFYDSRLIHSLNSPNRSTTSRMAVFVQYAFRWLQPVSRIEGRAGLDGQLTPVQQQLLGLGTSYHVVGGTAEGRSGRYYPRAHDAPLCFTDD